MITMRACLRLPFRSPYLPLHQRSIIVNFDSRIKLCNYAPSTIINPRLDTQQSRNHIPDFNGINFEPTHISFPRHTCFFIENSYFNHYTFHQNAMLLPMFSKKYMIISSSFRCFHKTIIVCTQLTSNSNTPKTRKAKGGYTSLSNLVKFYGWNFIVIYLSVYIITLGSLFVGLDSGLINSETLQNIQLPLWSSAATETNSVVNTVFSDGTPNSVELSKDSPVEKCSKSAVELISTFLEGFEFTLSYVRLIKENPHISNLAIAWVITKITEPIRVIFVLSIVPRVSIIGKRQ